jgi:ribosomal protein S16
LIKLRLQRKGRKKRPFYHIVVADSRSPRDGRIIERLGRYDNASENKELTYDEERVIHWLKIGAQPSNTVRNILKHEGIMYKMHLLRWGKSEEEIEEALTEWKEAREARADEDTSRKAQQKELLKAEENEYKKQLEEKAAKAAEELEREKKIKEAKAEKKEEDEAPKTPAGEIEAALEEAEKSGEEKTEEKAEAQSEEDKSEEESEEEVKADAEEKTEEETPAEAETKEEEPEVKEEVEAKGDSEEAEPEAEEKKQETAEADEEDEEEAKAEAESEESDEDEEEEKAEGGTVSTDMNANEAIDHIKNTPLEELEGFVPEDEDRVTVQRAWESKQSDSE